MLASGDPMMHGIGTTLVRMFGAERVRVLPHVSSVTLACARLGWAATDAEVISLVTVDPDTAVRRGGRAIVLSRDASSPAALARLLAETGRGDSELTILEQLGGPAERRRDGVARDWAAAAPADVDPLNVVAVRYLPDDRVLTTLPDDAFAHDGQLTKQMMRAVTLTALAPRPGELLWDVGSGSGSIAIEWCRTGSGCRAVAFEREEQRRARIVDNAVAFGARVDVRGTAPGAFEGADETVGHLHRRRADAARPARRLLDRAARRRSAGGQHGDRGVGSCCCAIAIRISAGSCAGFSTTAASRSGRSPAGARRCRSRNGLSSKARR